MLDDGHPISGEFVTTGELSFAIRSTLRSELSDIMAHGGPLRRLLQEEVSSLLRQHVGLPVDPMEVGLKDSEKQVLKEVPQSVEELCNQKVMHKHPGDQDDSPKAQVKFSQRETKAAAESEASREESRSSVDEDTLTEGHSRHARSKRTHNFHAIITEVKNIHKDTQSMIKETPSSARLLLDQVTHRGDVLAGKFDKAFLWWMRLHEPPRTGRLAKLVCSDQFAGKIFEAIVCLVIILNCVVMTITTDIEVASVGVAPGWTRQAEMGFLLFYTAELALKLLVHRLYFFANEHAWMNTLDCFLVILGYINLSAASDYSGSFLRIVRLLKVAKTMRALKVMVQFRELRAFCVCLHGSVSSFFWCLVMLTGVFFVFSLALVQMVTQHSVEEAGISDDMARLYGSVGKSMLTLYMASTNDWAEAYATITETGAQASITFILFIAFTQFALINIITGIFVESAMSTLSPSSEMLAVNYNRQEKEHASELEELCKSVDSDYSGKLTAGQFEEGVHRGRIPMLLQLLGMNKHHVIELFNNMSRMSEADNGEVDIGDFVSTCMLMKGTATNFDQHLLRAEVKTIHGELSQYKASVQRILERLDELAPPRPGNNEELHEV